MQTEKLNDNTHITANSKQLEILKTNFPNCFDKNGHFIAHKMEEIVKGNGLELSRESYSLNWLGKSYARLLANENPRTMLKADMGHNAKEENKESQNLLIKGDNLEVLKHLKNAYENQIKMIYIDPPYNTGGDGFVYNDDRKFTIDELSQLAGVSFEEAKRIIDFTVSKSNSHSAWLTFMYPRLYIARELMRDDGVIFISIDDNEAAQLKLLCDEVFGEENFITNLIWKNKKGGGNDSKYVAIEHEYIAMYAKNKTSLENLFETYKPEYLTRYKEEDEISKFFWDTFKRKSGKQYYPIECPDKSILEYDEHDNKISWLRSEKRFLSDKENNEIRFIKIEDRWSVQFKQRLPKGKKPRSILVEDSLLESSGTTSDGSSEVFELFKVNIFDNPKPKNLLINLMNIITEENDIVLDFFAGSGTTAHAIMELNVQDGGNRQFITVQLPEPIDPKNNKTAYEFVKKELKQEPTIFEITKERIIRASEKIKEEIAQDITKDIADYDLGFKIYETIPTFDNPLETMDKFDESKPTLFDVSILKEDDFNAILTTWKVHDGMRLTDDLEEIILKNYKAYYGDKKVYFVHSGFGFEDLKAFINKLDEDTTFEPNKLIVFGYTFESKYQREISEALANYTNKKSIEIDMVVRY